ncbi:MAG: HEAT repeat domain-containing protein [Phycisphaerales bacterium]|nr:MAG: HEAT repeat domain-containing protein [Phycisphaerales bacterium]
MSLQDLKKAPLTSLAGVVMVANTDAAELKAVDELIGRITDKSAETRTQAWLGAGEVGAPAVKPLAKVMTDKDLEVARAAKRALWKIARHAGRPGARTEKTAVVAELTGLLSDDHPVSVRREVLWMLSEIGTWRSVKPIAALLEHKELREDARMVLQRLPNKRAIRALKAGLKAAPRGFKLNIAQSLRQRGEKVRGLACVKLVPTKKTNVRPLE